jgi:DNA polymerase III epsilon subunit-like protein
MAKKQYKFTRILAIDCETTGLAFDQRDPTHNPQTGERHQTVSWGIAVLDTNFNIIEKEYVEIKWNKYSIEQRLKNPKHGSDAEKVHGLTKEYLDVNGYTEEQAIEIIGSIILRYWAPDQPITLFGHNVGTFDLYFLYDLFHRYGIELKFSSRCIDSFSIGFALFGTFNSNELFELTGCEAREHHNAMDDILMTVHSIKMAKKLFNIALGT